MKWNIMAPEICLWRKCHSLQKVLICAVVVTSFILIIIDVSYHQFTPLQKTKSQRGYKNYLSMMSHYTVHSSNVRLITVHSSNVSLVTVHSSNVSLIDLPDFQYHINNNICEDDIFLVIIIHSAPEHFDYRDTIRNTWGRSHVTNITIKTVFLLAKATSPFVQLALEAENAANRDIVQGNFHDSYKNLTYKHVMGLQWVSTYCPNAEFILKIDDDIFVNMFRLVKLLGKRFPKTGGKARLGKNIACLEWIGMPVMRDPNSKWFVTREEYSNNTYEPYCSGCAYVTSPEAALAISKQAHQLPYFWVDDEHVTGTVARHAGISRIDIRDWYDMAAGEFTEWSRSSEDIDWKLVFAPTNDMKLVRSAYKKALKCYTVQCPCCFKPHMQKPKL